MIFLGHFFVIFFEESNDNRQIRNTDTWSRDFKYKLQFCSMSNTPWGYVITEDGLQTVTEASQAPKALMAQPSASLHVPWASTVPIRLGVNYPKSSTLVLHKKTTFKPQRKIWRKPTLEGRPYRWPRPSSRSWPASWFKPEKISRTKKASRL